MYTQLDRPNHDRPSWLRQPELVLKDSLRLAVKIANEPSKAREFVKTLADVIGYENGDKPIYQDHVTRELKPVRPEVLAKALLKYVIDSARFKWDLTPPFQELADRLSEIEPAQWELAAEVLSAVTFDVERSTSDGHKHLGATL